MWTLLALVLVAGALIYSRLLEHYDYWRRKGVAGEKPVLFLGNMSGLGKGLHWTDINRRIYEKFSKTERFCGYFTFFSKAFFVMDLELIKKITISDFSSFADRGLFHNVKDDPLTGNLLFLDGPEWRWLRQNLTQVFTSGKMKFMFPTMLSVGEKLTQACELQVGEIEAKDLCARFSTDVIGSCAFGLECNSLNDPNSEFRRMGRSVTTNPLHTGMVQGFMFAQPKLARMLHMRLFRPEVSEFFLETVRQTLAYRKRENVQRSDLIQLLMDLGEEGTKDGLSFEQIAAQAMVFFLAGFDTSSTTMSFCLYELALNPDVQDRLRSEILEVLAKNNHQQTYESIQEMPYLDQVVAETLRKYPILPHIVRQTTKKYDVPDSRLTLEPGMRVMIPVHSIQHDPELYPEPENFDPSRFEPDQVKARHPMAYLPFGEGPRNCIGERFGKMQVKIGIAYILRDFQFRQSERTQIPLKFSSRTFLIGTQEGIHLIMEKLAAP
ncbi:probable cytochrome P450 6a13 [Drosophila pseudoobscura]|uniref:Probable cytochrome P450 6a13 n=1 Tax=Drosophila pseudoobscura pseudoobscura TaxID=46245 RepID=A0A6I8UVC6_DROPS|nr:probable cytochrome P450 6a13 [Drosophila pseudoobscura]